MGYALDEARGRTDSLFALIRPDSYYERPIPERHRIIFYLGHLEAFDWNLIARYALNRRSFHESFDKLFAFGIDPPPGQLPADTAGDWPSLTEVARYNRRTREEIDEMLEDVPEQLLHVAIEHRLMHAETFGYILHQLDYDRKLAPPLSGETPSAPAGEHWSIDIPAGTAQLGQTGGEFGWDNEFEPHEAQVPAFSIAKYKVTNGEYLEFVAAGSARAVLLGAARRALVSARHVRRVSAAARLSGLCDA